MSTATLSTSSIFLYYQGWRKVFHFGEGTAENGHMKENHDLTAEKFFR